MKPSADNFRNWCSSTTFADNVINTCEFCYNLTSEDVNPGTTGAQVYLANCAIYPIPKTSQRRRRGISTHLHFPTAVIESIRYDCHFPGIVGEPFAISPTRIFTGVLLPSSLSLTTPSPDSGVNLGVVVGLPIMGFVIILLLLGICCFFFIRYRRKRARRESEQSQLYARWNDTIINTPKQDPSGWGWPGGYSDQDPHVHSPAAAGYGYGPGFGFMDSDGSGQQVGYGRD